MIGDAAPLHIAFYSFIPSLFICLSRGLRNTAYIMSKKPTRHTTGATLIRLALKISGSKCVGVDTGPVIRIKPIITPPLQRQAG